MLFRWKDTNTVVREFNEKHSVLLGKLQRVRVFGLRKMICFYFSFLLNASHVLPQRSHQPFSFHSGVRFVQSICAVNHVLDLYLFQKHRLMSWSFCLFSSLNVCRNHHDKRHHHDKRPLLSMSLKR